ncbi:ATP-dependent DNA ligase [Streptomyces althioticus]|uniref:ATP-dependent DNA ligase n=1 Tax=Streptomyces althioticus TaxID=83380 RepID=UPI0036C1ECD4
MWTLPEPMLAAPTPDPVLLAGWAAETKFDGWRGLLSWSRGNLVLRSRQGTMLADAFPEVQAAAVQLPDRTALDGELIVWENGRLAFERLQGRLQRRGPAAARLAEEWPAHFVAFDLLRLEGTDTTSWWYERRRAALEQLYAEHGLSGTWALCPSTTEQSTVDDWLAHWTAVGIEGVVFKRLRGTYEPGVRGGWKKYKVRHTEDAIVGACTGPAAAPRTLLLGRYDTAGRLRYIGRTTTLPQTAGRALAPLLAPARPGHPWTGWTFSAGWGTNETLHVALVEPELVVEVGVDVARDNGGRWRHAARWHRARPDVAPGEVPPFEQ